MLVHNCKIYGAQICFRTDTMKVSDTKEALFAAWNTRWQPNGDISDGENQQRSDTKKPN